MPWAVAAAAIGVGGSLLSSSMSSNASQQAAQTQANAADAAAQVQLQMFNQTQKNLQPYMQGGQNSLAAMMQYLGIGPNGQFNPNAPGVQPFSAATFQQSPGYAWQKQQGIDAIQNSAAARGGVASGNTLQALDTFGTGLANQDYYNALNAYTQQQNNVFNKLYSLTGTGANAAANLGGFSGNAAGAIGGNLVGAGNALAAGQVGSANALAGGVNSGLSSLMALLNSGQGQSAFSGLFGGSSGGSGGGGGSGGYIDPSQAGLF